MGTPYFDDIGIPFSFLPNYFGWGFLKLNGKAKTSDGVEFKTGLTSNRDSGKFTGNLESKYKWSDYGLTLTEKWNTDNVLNTELKTEDYLADGLELSCDVNSSFNPPPGHRVRLKGKTKSSEGIYRELAFGLTLTDNKTGNLKTGFKHDNLALNCDLDFDGPSPTVHGAAVFGYEGWLAGYEMSFDSYNSRLTRSNFGFGFLGGDSSFTIHVNNDLHDQSVGQEFIGSVHQKVNSQLDAAAIITWQAGSGSTFTVGAKYKLDNDDTVNIKVNNSSQLCIGYTQRLAEGIKLSVSSMLDGANINSGGHKIGLGFDFEP